MTSEKLLTAAQARDLMRSNTPDYHIDLILEQVTKAATAGESKLKTYACNFGDGALYSGMPTPLQQAVMDGLTALGYAVQVRVEERQLVDIWLEVSWT